MNTLQVSLLLLAGYLLALIACVVVIWLDRRRNRRVRALCAEALIAETESFLAGISS
jgi:hypothetical protein